MNCKVFPGCLLVCILILRSQALFGQAAGHYFLEAPPYLNAENNISALDLWEYDTDSAGNVVSEGRLFRTTWYDTAGTKYRVQQYDSSGNLESQFEYYDVNVGPWGSGEIYGRFVTKDAAGGIIEERKTYLNDNGQLVSAGATLTFKPCYMDYIYNYHENRLFAEALLVRPVVSFTMGRDEPVRAVKKYVFIYSLGVEGRK